MAPNIAAVGVAGGRVASASVAGAATVDSVATGVHGTLAGVRGVALGSAVAAAVGGASTAPRIAGAYRSARASRQTLRSLTASMTSLRVALYGRLANRKNVRRWP